ncbi:MAG: chemotaxis protein CheX [Pirellulales bacterium]|nr:chemotaxis protein CheX [Pirellulales bacterium]
MATASVTCPANLGTDSELFKAIAGAVESCLTMCDTRARCVGMSTVPTRDPGVVTGLIGVHGDVSGFITVNMAEHVARSAVGGLLQDRFDTLTSQVIDGVGEMTNIISGGIKNGLSGTPWGFKFVTVPSVIVGNNYQIAYASGLEYLCVTFEHQNEDALLLDQRILQVAVSLIRL